MWGEDVITQPWLREARGGAVRIRLLFRGCWISGKGTPGSLERDGLRAVTGGLQGLAMPAPLTPPLCLQDYNIDEEAALQAALALSLSEN